MEKWPGFFQAVEGQAAKCVQQLRDLTDRDLVLEGFPINRHISDAIEIFADLEDIELFLSLKSDQRYNLTHPPVSTININPASPLHAYTCLFRWFNLLVYHLNIRKKKWGPTSLQIKTSMQSVRTLVEEKTGLIIDQPDSRGGTSSTGNVARQAFSESDYINCVLSLVDAQHRDSLLQIHTNVSSILRIINSSQKVKTDLLGTICKD